MPDNTFPYGETALYLRFSRSARERDLPTVAPGTQNEKYSRNRHMNLSECAPGKRFPTHHPLSRDLGVVVALLYLKGAFVDNNTSKIAGV